MTVTYGDDENPESETAGPYHGEPMILRECYGPV
jgi:hypothetical protein